MAAAVVGVGGTWVAEGIGVSVGGMAVADGTGVSDEGIAVADGTGVSDGVTAVADGTGVSDGVTAVADGTGVSDGVTTVADGTGVSDGGMAVAKAVGVCDGGTAVADGCDPIEIAVVSLGLGPASLVSAGVCPRNVETDERAESAAAKATALAVADNSGSFPMAKPATNIPIETVATAKPLTKRLRIERQDLLARMGCVSPIYSLIYCSP